MNFGDYIDKLERNMGEPRKDVHINHHNLHLDGNSNEFVTRFIDVQDLQMDTSTGLVTFEVDGYTVKTHISQITIITHKEEE